MKTLKDEAFKRSRQHERKAKKKKNPTECGVSKDGELNLWRKQGVPATLRAVSLTVCVSTSPSFSSTAGDVLSPRKYLSSESTDRLLAWRRYLSLVDNPDVVSMLIPSDQIDTLSTDRKLLPCNVLRD